MAAPRPQYRRKIRRACQMQKSPLEDQGAFRACGARALPLAYHLAGTVTGASAAPAGSFMNWKKLELGSTTSTSPGLENEAR